MEDGKPPVEDIYIVNNLLYGQKRPWWERLLRIRRTVFGQRIPYWWEVWWCRNVWWKLFGGYFAPWYAKKYDPKKHIAGFDYLDFPKERVEVPASGELKNLYMRFDKLPGEGSAFQALSTCCKAGVHKQVRKGDNIKEIPWICDACGEQTQTQWEKAS